MKKTTIAKAVGFGIAGVAAGTAVVALAHKDTRDKVSKTFSGLVENGRSTIDQIHKVVHKDATKPKN